MPTIQIYLDEKEDEIVRRFSRNWKIKSKYQTVRRMIKEYDTLQNGQNTEPDTH